MELKLLSILSLKYPIKSTFYLNIWQIKQIKHLVAQILQHH